jgi:quinolinate synthase
MYQEPLPAEYQNLPDEEIAARIRAAKATLGPKVVILGHHYQRDEIIEHADFRGDSYKLCLDASARPEAEFIVFCGVHFMAESADILTDKRVILPNLAAGCSMADMANLFQVKACWKQLGEIGCLQPASGGGSSPKAGIIPITYINSAASLKGFVGEKGGTVCTSTNAPTAVQWAVEQGEKVLFFPDQHLGRNTGVKLGYDPGRDMVLWDPFKPLGGNTPERIKEATFILWKGHCSVHGRFTVDQIEKARREHPGVHVIVHPECPLDVVQASDFNGSTEVILKTVTNAPTGSMWAIGTEINLVSRLAKENPDKTIFCLDPQICPCSTMYRIHPSFLLWALENLVAGRVVNEIVVPEKTAQFARLALDRMIAIGKPKD